MHKRLVLALLLLSFLIFVFGLDLYYLNPDFHIFIDQLFLGK